ncbi:MAG: hypothetical protein HY787_16480 [Deltaproteobacteria bacterium]|nr:hypothetical protein [Deltaproteobacteria bacterium]
MENLIPITDINKTIPPFSRTLSQNQLVLTRLNTTTLQINMGLLCNQECRHCHLEAGPNRPEVMTIKTVQEVIEFAPPIHKIGPIDTFYPLSGSRPG